MWWAWRWLLFAAVLAGTTALPVPDDDVDTSTKLIGSSVVTSVSVIMGHEDGNSEKSERKKGTEDLPPSTVDMLKPDGFQFYTVDEKGQLITRQMTDSEIQSIIAAGGGPFPMETQDPQKTGENNSGGMKVADVVENVQKVLKGELNKPATAMGSMPTIPGHANDEWSSILPSILGGESESAPVTLEEIDNNPMEEMVKQNISKVESPAATTTATSIENLPAAEMPVTKTSESGTPVAENVKPIKEETMKTDEMVKTDEKQKVGSTDKPEKTDDETPAEPQETERPMIQVPVITAESVQSTTKNPSSLVDEKPVYQILNTISAEEVKNKDAQVTGEEKPADKEPEKTITVSVPVEKTPDSSSTTEKIESEVKKPEPLAPQLPSATTENIVEMENKLETSTVQKETEEITKPSVDTQKVDTPSIILEAPLEKPVDPVIKSEEKEPEVIPEVKKPETEEDKTDKKPMIVDQTPSTPSQQTESTTLAATVEEEVSQMVNLIPESISSIVDELISGGNNDVSKDQVKSENPETSGEKKPEVSSNQDETKVQGTNDETKDSNSPVSEEHESSNSKVTPVEVPAPQIPESGVEPVFEMLPEIKPESSTSKTESETQTASENVGTVLEKTEEAVSEPSKTVNEETVPVAVVVDKIEQPSGEMPENLIPVIEVAAPMNTGFDNKTADNKNDESDNKATEETTLVEKKPETLLTELADSVSSMISQVSEIMPSMVPIPQKSTETTEQPAKRVEDEVNMEEASTVRSEEVPSTNEEAGKPVVEDVDDLSVKEETTKPNVASDKPLVEDADSPVKEEMKKPEESEPEMVLVEVKIPEPTTISSIPEISEPISASVPVQSDELEAPTSASPSESSSDVEKTESVTKEKETTEEVSVTPADSAQATKISEDAVQSEEALKPEDTKPEKIETVVIAEGIENETNASDAEAPIVRIDITEAKPTVSDIKNDESTESSVVRIQLTNPIATINQMIDSAPEVVPPTDVQEVLLPEKNILEASSPQNAASSLIAGPQALNITEIKIPGDLPEMDDTTLDKNQISNEPSTTESAKINSEDKTTVKPNEEISSDDKSKPEIESTKNSEAEVTQATTEMKLEMNDEGNKKPLMPEPEIIKTSEKSDETKLEKPVEIDESVESMVKIDPPVSVGEKIVTPAKIEDQEKVLATTDKIVEAATVVSEEKIEEKPIKESTEVPVANDTPKIVPAEVVVSTTVDVDKPVEESSDKIEADKIEVLKSEEKPEETMTKIDKPEPIPEKESEADKTVTKINDETQSLAPVASNTPTTKQPDLQTSENVLNASTVAVVVSGDKKADTTEVPQKVDVPAVTAQTDSDIQNTESTDKKTELNNSKNELPGEKESAGNMAQSVEDANESVEAKPEEVKTEDPKSPSSAGSKPAEKEVPGDIKESSVSVPVQKEQPSVPSVPLVRIDITPEKNQPESSTTKIDEIQDSKDADDKKIEETDKPEITVTTEMNLSQAEKPQKEADKPKDDSEVQNSSAKPAVGVETTITVLESSSKAPEGVITEETKVQEPAVKESEVVVKVAGESVKETVDSKVPEVTAASTETSSTASPSPTRIEGEGSVKPVVKVDTNSQTASHNKPPKTQEIRIQVNDTAVLVTKQQIPQKTESDEKRVQPTEISDSGITKIEVSSEQPEKIEVSSQKPEKVELSSLQPTKAPSVEKPALMTNIQQTDKTTSKKDADKVKVESVTEQKKPTADPYVKLGEKKPETKPAGGSVLKTPISSNKKPVNTEVKKDSEEKWTLIPQNEPYPIVKQEAKPSEEVPSSGNKNQDVSVPLEAHQSAVSLNESTRDQDEDISLFAKLCNELAFSFWISANKGLSTARSLALSPFGMTSMLAMVFLGARGPTSGQMNDILKLDDVVTFNPHLVFQNVTDSVNLARGQGIANAAFVRELFADRVKAGRILPFYKERAQQFYDGHVEEVNFATISDLVRRRTNLLIRRQTGGRIRDFVKGNVMPLRSPLAALSANVFQTDCTGASSEGRDGEMYFAVLPAVRQRKLVPVPATVWRSGVLAGYEPGLDATVISLGGVGNLVSTIFVLPGQQGLAAPGDSLDHLERRLLEGAFTNGVWDRLIRVLIPRMGLEVQVPKFSHRSVVNATAALKRMGLDDLFSKHADLKGINGIGNDLHLADMLQINLFSTCGDEVITGGRHHVEIYPASPFRGARAEEKSIETENEEEDSKLSEVETEEKRTRRSLTVGEYIEDQSRDLGKRSTPQTASKQLIPEDKNDEERSQRSSNNPKEELSRLVSKGKQNDRPLIKLDRPFLYFVRHNPTGMILHMGRFNPRLMP